MVTEIFMFFYCAMCDINNRILVRAKSAVSSAQLGMRGSSCCRSVNEGTSELCVRDRHGHRGAGGTGTDTGGVCVPVKKPRET